MQLEVGAILEGVVSGITKFGAFVDLPGGKTGMVHISEISNTYVKEITDHITDGQEVKVKILSISDDGKISLSIKKCMEQTDQPEAERPPFRQPKPQGNRPPRNVGWNPQQKPVSNEKMSFEDMMSSFKKASDDKMSDLKRGNEVRRARRGKT